MSVNMYVRPYESSDQDALLDLWLAASQVGHSFLDDADIYAQLRVLKEQYCAAAEIWVAESRSKLLGFIALLDDQIVGLYVSPAAHGMGIGRTLLEEAAERRQEPLFAEVYEQNSGALAFFERCGFIRNGRKEKDVKGRPRPLVCLCMDKGAAL